MKYCFFNYNANSYGICSYNEYFFITIKYNTQKKEQALKDSSYQNGDLSWSLGKKKQPTFHFGLISFQTAHKPHDEDTISKTEDQENRAKVDRQQSRSYSAPMVVQEQSEEYHESEMFDTHHKVDVREKVSQKKFIKLIIHIFLAANFMGF